jgi:hypothetical protein
MVDDDTSADAEAPASVPAPPVAERPRPAAPAGGAGRPDVDPASPEIPDEVDPKVAELVVTIRDRFGLRGLRGARWMIAQEIALAEEAMADLTADG